MGSLNEFHLHFFLSSAVLELSEGTRQIVRGNILSHTPTQTTSAFPNDYLCPYKDVILQMQRNFLQICRKAIGSIAQNRPTQRGLRELFANSEHDKFIPPAF